MNPLTLRRLHTGRDVHASPPVLTRAESNSSCFVRLRLCSGNTTFTAVALYFVILASPFSMIVVCTADGSEDRGAVTSDSGESPVAAELTPENMQHLMPCGKEVDAIYGDIVLQNAHIRAVIAKPVPARHANMTVRDVGGCLIDLTVRDAESDQLSAFFPGRRKQKFGDSATAVVSETGDSAAVTVRSEGNDSKPDIQVKYQLSSQSYELDVITTWNNTTQQSITLTPEDDIRADAGTEDMVKVSDGLLDLFWFQDRFWRQAYGVRAEGFRLRCSSNPRESVLVYESSDGKPIVLMPGESFSLRRQILVAADLPAVISRHEQLSGTSTPAGRVRLVVVDGFGEPVQAARIALRIKDQVRGTTVTDQNGAATVSMPAGLVKAEIHVDGQKYAEQIVDVRPSAGIPELILPLSDFRPGRVQMVVTDANGLPIPAKVEFDGQGETPTPDWGPQTAEHFVRNLAYTPDGTVETRLAAGDYDVIVSHGPEYNAKFTKLHIDGQQTTELSVSLMRAVDTSGWVSADFHSHSTPSGDNTSSQLGRVLNLAAEHIEFAPCTEHNRVSTYDDHIRSEKLESFIATVSGIELTGSPLPLNHQNAFPLVLRPGAQDGGGPVTDNSPETQLERLAAWDNHSDKLIQQNHPDIGWLFFDRDGDQKRDEGYSRSFDIMQVIEIHPIDPLLNPTRYLFYEGKAVGNLTALNWLQLLNQGYRVWGVVNTDAHSNFHGSGGLRNWLKSDTDDPSLIRIDQMRDAARNGRSVMSTGPFLEASFQETGSLEPPVISGSDLTAASGRVTGRVRVQCPNWISVDFVAVLVNGRRRDDLTFTRDQQPELFGADSVQFDRTLNFQITEDSHLIAITGHRTALLGDVQGPEWAGRQHPAALTNPVFVDLQGDGFQANRDTLDFPLPLKFQSEK